MRTWSRKEGTGKMCRMNSSGKVFMATNNKRAKYSSLLDIARNFIRGNAIKLAIRLARKKIANNPVRVQEVFQNTV